ncbi:MAG: hypothetical protein ACRC6K_07725 [Fusobacteriaceae bacterium]
MKKILLGLMLLLSMVSFAGRNDAKENDLEMEILKNYSVIKDGNKEIGIKDLDVDMEVSRTKVEIELYDGTGDISFSALENYSKEIANFVKKDLGNNNKVLVEIEVDREGVLGDKKLIRKLF